MAKKVAVLRGVSQEEYITPLLILCAKSVEDEIKQNGILGVRDRAESIPDIEEYHGGYSTFNSSVEVATRLTSLAGQCLTSVAKLIDRKLRSWLELDLVAAAREVQVLSSTDVFDADYKAFLLRQKAKGLHTPIWIDTPGITHSERLFGGRMFTLANTGIKSLTDSGVESGKSLILHRRNAVAGDVVVVTINDNPYLADTTESPEGKLELHPRVPGMAALEVSEVFHLIHGVVIGTVSDEILKPRLRHPAKPLPKKKDTSR